MNITSLSDGIVRINREDGEYLGISTGISKRTFHLTKLTERKESSGLFIRGNTIEEWPIEGFTEADGAVYLTGRFHEGVLLSEVLRTSDGSGLRYFRILASCFKLMKERSLPLPSIFSNGILFTRDDGVLLFPVKSMETINQHHPITYQMTYFEPFNHPDLKDEENISFALGVFAYRAVTDRFPVEVQDESELHEKTRTGVFLPPVHIRPALKSEVSQFITLALDGKNGRRPSLETWMDRLTTWENEGIERPISDEEKTKILKDAEELQKRQNTSYSRKSFFRKHGMKLGAAAAVTVGIIWVTSSILGNILAPRVTRGFSPEQVVKTFYSSINTLDHATMEDCVTDDAGKPYINEAMNYFVITRMRLSVEGTTGFIPAEEWRAAGKKAPPIGHSVFGVTDLKVELVPSQVPEEKSFIAEFEKWQPLQAELTPDAVSAVQRSEGERIRERVFLKLENGDWVIYRIERLSETPVGTIEAESRT